MNNPINRRRIIYFAILAFVALLAFLLIIRPALNAPNERLEAEAQMSSEIHALQKQVASLKETEAKLPTIEAQIEKLNSKFPSLVNPVTITKNVRAAAKAAGINATDLQSVAIDEVQPYVPPAERDKKSAKSKKDDDSTIKELPISITATATPAQGMRFAQNLANSEMAFYIETVRVAESAVGGGKQVNITAYAFLLPSLDKK